MKLTKQQQNGLLLVLYLSRSGRCNLAEVGKELSLSIHFLEQIACKLRRAGVLKSTKGPGGGYSVSDDPSVGQVLYALGSRNVGAVGFSKSPERRALGHLFGAFTSAINPVFKRKVRSLNMELAANETAAFDSVQEATVN